MLNLATDRQSNKQTNKQTNATTTTHTQARIQHTHTGTHNLNDRKYKQRNTHQHLAKWSKDGMKRASKHATTQFAKIQQHHTMAVQYAHKKLERTLVQSSSLFVCLLVYVCYDTVCSLVMCACSCVVLEVSMSMYVICHITYYNYSARQPASQQM